MLLAEKGKTVAFANVEKTKIYLPLGTDKDLYYPLKNDELNDVKIETEVYPLKKIPVDYKKELGNIKISLKNRLLFNEKLFTII